MATDIHLWVEVRDGDDWKLAEPEWLCGDCEGYGSAVADADGTVVDCPVCAGAGRVTRWQGRNPPLFWALGGVTDAPSGPAWEPFAVNRGWPQDGVSAELACIAPGGGDPATTSWITLAEWAAYFEQLPRHVKQSLSEQVTVRFMPACAALADRLEDVRLVYNFSS